MARIVLPRRKTLTAQPQGVARVDPSSPIIGAIAGEFGYTNSSASLLLNVAGSSTIAVSSVGRGVTFSGAGANTKSAPVSGAIPAASPFTIEVLCSITAAPSLAGFAALSSFPRVTGNCRGLIAFGGGSNRNIYFWGYSADLASGVDWRVDGNPQHVFCVSEGSGAPMRFYRDGALIANGTTPTLVATTATSLYVGDMVEGWSSVPAGTISKAVVHSRALSASEIAELTANPWQLFARPAARVFMAGGGSAASAISSASGASTASTLSGSSTASTTVASASGASTASALVGSSAAVSTIGSASGVSTASTMAGQAVTVASISAADGAATADALAGSSTAVSAPSAAAGTSTVSALTGASTAVATIGAATGASTASTMTAVTDGSVIGTAAGAATASTMAGSSVAVATMAQANGAATASALPGSSTAAAAILSATGASATSTLVGSNVGGVADIAAAAGVSTTSTLAGSSVAVASMDAAVGTSTTSAMAGSDITFVPQIVVDRTDLGGGSGRRARRSDAISRTPVDRRNEEAEVVEFITALVAAGVL